MSIGLYDIDLYHGDSFSLSLPLMKIYNYFYNKNQKVIMMKKLADTDRFNQVIYFKDNPNCKIPKTLKIDTKKGTLIGYGFFKKSGLKNDKIIQTSPNFTPYDLTQKFIKNIVLYRSIRYNNIIDWREKDFTGLVNDKKIYVADRDFLMEEDWKEIFSHFKNRQIGFVHPLFCDNLEQFETILKLSDNKIPNVVAPKQLKYIDLEQYFNKNTFCINNTGLSDEELFKIIFAAKVLNDKISFVSFKKLPKLQQEFIKWNNSDRISFQDYLGEKYDEKQYRNFKYSYLLKQNPLNFDRKDLLKNNIL